eukprot:CAMPEP_0182456592 /NCGR_PEP_ID=MMETSP1319-20130603/2383_1 /TAXON_ID=172717 /ORGANISM="Bolidomonas pacifica, Strain RCC208" /LENGTH=189 /DNA_ID=CAMNT_0024654871 /DNA_START=423 /DNA_END=992 /DNA_ORIENTATION=-
MNGALVLSPSEVETVHLTINSVMQCPFCTGLHCELGRMSGLDSYSLNSSLNLESALANTPHPSIALYSHNFATRGRHDPKDYRDLASSIGSSLASAVSGLSWFLRWGAFGGNTILSLSSSPAPLAAAVGLYYAPLYAVIKAVSKCMEAMPTGGPEVVGRAVGLTLPVVAGVWIVPLGVLGGLGKVIGVI